MYLLSRTRLSSCPRAASSATGKPTKSKKHRG